MAYFFPINFKCVAQPEGKTKALRCIYIEKKSDFCKVEKEIHCGLHAIARDGCDVTGVNSPKNVSRIADICHSAILCQSNW